MKRNRKFDNILDECLERLLVQDETVEQCLESYPEYAEVLKPLLSTALSARSLSDIQPRSEFKDRARYEFRLALQKLERKRSRPAFVWNWQPRWATVVAVVLAVLLTGSGTVAAASGSMPDEPLYPVKLATEQIQLTLTPSALGKAELYAELADKRVDEIVRMAGEGKAEKVDKVALRLDDYLAKIADLASTQRLAGNMAMAPASGEAPAVAPPVVMAPAPAPAPQPTAELPPVVMAPAPQASSEVPSVTEEVPALSRDATAFSEQDKSKKEDQPGDEHRTKLKQIISQDADNNMARLRAELEKAPESARSALQRAIAASEHGYKKALESLDD